jgi:hypothetical protein
MLGSACLSIQYLPHLKWTKILPHAIKDIAKHASGVKLLYLWKAQSHGSLVEKQDRPPINCELRRDLGMLQSNILRAADGNSRLAHEWVLSKQSVLCVRGSQVLCMSKFHRGQDSF